jgi:hypothetical protein
MTVRLHFDALLTGTVEGPQGETGPTGPTGATGAAGPTGPTGPAGEVAMPRLYVDDASPTGLNSNYRYFAVGSGNLAFDLPVAADNAGAVISVTDISGTVRDIAVSPAGGEDMHAPAGAATMTAAYSSRTFVAIEGNGIIGPGWVITASVGA